VAAAANADGPGDEPMPLSVERVELVQALARVLPAVRAYAYAILRDFHLAEDAAQEVALLAAARWEELPRDEAFLAWARETARRKALEFRRKAAESRRRGRAFAAEISEETWIAVESRFRDPGPDLAGALQDCLSRLPPPARDAVVARYGENRPCEEIAGRLGRTVQSIYALLKRARLALIECVDRRALAPDRETRP
jgi:RNA polymerase sigma-70 factor (ECF subfamily)